MTTVPSNERPDINIDQEVVTSPLEAVHTTLEMDLDDKFLKLIQKHRSNGTFDEAIKVILRAFKD